MSAPSFPPPNYTYAFNSGGVTPSKSPTPTDTAATSPRENGRTSPSKIARDTMYTKNGLKNGYQNGYHHPVGINGKNGSTTIKIDPLFAAFLKDMGVATELHAKLSVLTLGDVLRQNHASDSLHSSKAASSPKSNATSSPTSVHPKSNGVPNTDPNHKTDH